jgi:hypothetical protein
MAKEWPQIEDGIREFIDRQPMFFVATACGDDELPVNCSPKGLWKLVTLGPHRVGYIDYHGSDNVTARHLNGGGRITIMLCSFDKRPVVVRLHGRGRAILGCEEEFQQLARHFEGQINRHTRQIIVVEVEKVTTSCGYGVPRMKRPKQRDDLIRWHDRKFGPP